MRLKLHQSPGGVKKMSKVYSGEHRVWCMEDRRQKMEDGSIGVRTWL